MSASSEHDLAVHLELDRRPTCHGSVAG
jgi:hypothetical protein